MKVDVVVRNLVDELGPTASTDSEVMTITEDVGVAVEVREVGVEGVDVVGVAAQTVLTCP